MRIPWRSLATLAVGVACFVLVFFVAWALGLIPAYIKECPYNEHTGHEECATYHIALFTFLQIGKGLNWIAPAIGAAATIVIAFFTRTLWKATDRLRKAGDKQAELTRILERAYISVKPLGINPFISKHGVDRIVGHVAFINVGRLPARNVSVKRACMKWDHRGDLPDTDILIKPIRPMTIVLTPGTEMRHGTNNIAASELLKPGPDSYIYVWGQVNYTDGFGVSRYTRFCHRYPCIRHEPVDKGKGISLEHARYNQHGNDAT